mgnify:FL=1
MNNTMDNVNLRAVVLDILLENDKNPGHSNLITGQALSKFQYLPKSQRAFISRLAEGTIERRIEEDWLIDHVSSVSTKKMKPVIRNIMRMSAYQLKYMDSVPVSAVCNEAVKLARKRGFSSLTGFVNGVLRSLARDINNIQYPDKSDFIRYCMIRYSMPEYVVRILMDECGSCTEDVLKGFEKEHRLYIRCNTGLITPGGLKKKLTDEGVTVEDTCVPYAFAISGYDYLADLTSFEEGLFQVQDLSSILAGLAVNPNPGDYVVDVCAAPGGKCLHAAQRGSDITVEARDVSEAKVGLIRDNIERLHMDNVTAKVWDATVKDESLIGKADILICDVPCSGLGILGRKADIRYNASAEKTEALVELQRKILSVCSEYVRPGGYIIYSTCTINPAENEDNVDWFTANYPFETDSIEKDYPMLEKDSLAKGYVQLLPGIDNTDGFFIARLKKKDVE